MLAPSVFGLARLAGIAAEGKVGCGAQAADGCHRHQHGSEPVRQSVEEGDQRKIDPIVTAQMTAMSDGLSGWGAALTWLTIMDLERARRAEQQVFGSS